MATYFFISLAVHVISVVCGTLNLGVERAGGKLNGKTMLLHIVCVFCCVIGGLATFITGVIWIVQQFA